MDELVLNADLNSMNSILTCDSLVFRWVRVEWRAVEMVSSVEWLDQYANWKRVQGRAKGKTRCVA